MSAQQAPHSRKKASAKTRNSAQHDFAGAFHTQAAPSSAKGGRRLTQTMGAAPFQASLAGNDPTNIMGSYKLKGRLYTAQKQATIASAHASTISNGGSMPTTALSKHAELRQSNKRIVINQRPSVDMGNGSVGAANNHSMGEGIDVPVLESANPSSMATQPIFS